VVDAGSAITVDAMDDRGLHLGGLIAPGLSMMRTALLEGTGNLRAFSDASGPSRGAVFPADTGPAIEEGVGQAATGLVEGAMARVTAHLGVSPTVFLTGGDAEALARGLATPVRIEADLALEGLARMAAG
jgi:type III pantothenate kinase